MQRDDSWPTDDDVDALLDEFGGDAREAIRALLHDLDALAGDYAADVSHGFVRGAIVGLTRRLRRC